MQPDFGLTAGDYARHRAGFPPSLGEAGFGDLQTLSYDVVAPYTPEGWRGRIRASAGVRASLSNEKVAIFDGALAQLLATRFPGEVLEVPHRGFAVIARAPVRP